MPPSERAKRRSLYLRRTGDHKRSAAAWTMLMGCRLIITSMGASTEVIRSSEDEPRCMQMMVPSSEQAFQKGSQWLLCREGQPNFSGFSENVTAWHPILATRRTSSAINSGFQIMGMDRGMNRPGSAPHHCSMCQLL